VKTPIWGVVGTFEEPAALLRAARLVHDAGYRRIDAYTPFAVEGLDAALGFRRTWIPALVLAGGLVGAGGGYFMQWFAMAVWYPLNVGGRPLDSWPLFIPITFELSVLVGGLTAAFGMLALNRLPMPYHPLFNVPAFARATQDRFFLGVEARDARFDRRRTAELLLAAGATEVCEVAH
jgi:ActD protein